MAKLSSDMVSKQGKSIAAPFHMLGVSTSKEYDQWARSHMHTAEEKARRSVLNIRGDFVLEGAPNPGGSVMPSGRLTHVQEEACRKGNWKALSALLKEDK